MLNWSEISLGLLRGTEIEKPMQRSPQSRCFSSEPWKKMPRVSRIWMSRITHYLLFQKSSKLLFGACMCVCVFMQVSIVARCWCLSQSLFTAPSPPFISQALSLNLRLAILARLASELQEPSCLWALALDVLASFSQLDTARGDLE